jgi:maltose alpha-D-glucosyltransferase/alpha-amylase
VTLGVLHEFVPHQGDGWRYCKDALGLYFERVLTRQAPAADLPLPSLPAARLADEPVPPLAAEVIGPVLEAARVLGRRTAELHLALASGGDDPAFAPEPFTSLYQRSLYQSMRSQTRKTFVQLRRHRDRLPEDVRAAAGRLEEREEELLKRVRRVFEQKVTAARIRCHGDYDLREVLYDGRDVTIIDLEGEARRPLSDRRRKYTPLRDVASMLRSFHYVALAALHGGGVRREDRPALQPWARLWHTWVSAAFLKAYREVARAGTFLPAAPEQFETLLDFYVVERAISELRSELAHVVAAGPGAAPSAGRAAFPIGGLLQLLEAHG